MARKKKRDGVILSFEARKYLAGKRRNSEHPAMSRAHFAELTGVSKSLIDKRDGEEVGLVSGARSLYQLILDLYDESPTLMPDVISALEGVPREVRSEERALGALINLAAEKGLRHLVSWALGDVEVKREEEVGLAGSAEVTLRAIGRIKDSLRRDAMRADGEDSGPLQDMAADLARVYERFEMFLEKKRGKDGEGSQ